MARFHPTAKAVGFLARRIVNHKRYDENFDRAFGGPKKGVAGRYIYKDGKVVPVKDPHSPGEESVTEKEAYSDHHDCTAKNRASQQERLTRTLPPVEIFDVLHDYEARGGTIPAAVDKWWEIETSFMWQKLDRLTKKK